MTDPISDMLTRIRNAQMVRKSEVVLPYSKIKFSIAQTLSKEGWLGKIEKIEPLLLKKTKSVASAKGSSLPISRRGASGGKFNQLKIELLYQGKQPKISNIKRVSKPGRRVYAPKDKLPTVLNNYGIAIISTPQGLMTNKQARKEGVGGEVICEIY